MTGTHARGAFPHDRADTTLHAARKRRLRRLALIFGLAGIVVVAYGTYWLGAAARLRSLHAKFIHAQRLSGVEITAEAVQVTGFPYRLTVVVRRPDIRFDTGWRWQAERAIAHVSPFDPSRFALDLSRGTHIVTTRNGEEWQIEARRFLGRARLRQRRLVDLGLKAEEVQAVHRNGLMRVASFVAFSAIPDNAPDIVRLALRAHGGEVAPGLHGQAWLGSRLENAEAAIELPGGAAADLLQSLFSPFRLRRWAEDGGEVVLKGSRLAWGPARIEGRGSLGLDPFRRPQGSLRLEFDRAGDLTEALIASRMVSPRAGDALRLAASLARLNGGRAPLRFALRDGAMTLGPVKVFRLAPLP